MCDVLVNLVGICTESRKDVSDSFEFYTKLFIVVKYGFILLAKNGIWKCNLTRAFVLNYKGAKGYLAKMIRAQSVRGANGVNVFHVSIHWLNIEKWKKVFENHFNQKKVV